MCLNVPLVKIVAVFKAHHYQVERKLQKSYEPSKTTSPSNYFLQAVGRSLIIFKECH